MLKRRVLKKKKYAKDKKTSAHGLVLSHMRAGKTEGAKSVHPTDAVRMLQEASAHLDLDKDIPIHHRTQLSKYRIVMPKEIDGRTLRGRMYRDVYQSALADQGGAEFSTTTQWAACRSFAAVAVIKEELLESYFFAHRNGGLGGKAFQFFEALSDIIRVETGLVRVLGMRRIPKPVSGVVEEDVPKTLEEYVGKQYA